MTWRDKALLHPREVAEVLSLSLRTVQAMLADGRLEHVMVGGARRVPVDAVRRMAGESVMQPAPTKRDKRVEQIVRDLGAA